MKLKHLTPKEMEIVKLMCLGLCAKEVALVIGRSAKTVECARGVIYKKTNTSNPVLLFRWALLSGMIEVSDEPIEQQARLAPDSPYRDSRKYLNPLWGQQKKVLNQARPRTVSVNKSVALPRVRTAFAQV